MKVFSSGGGGDVWGGSVTFKMRQLTIMVMMIIIILLIIISQRFINKYLNTQPGYARQSKHNDCGGSVGGGA